jgi:hypothetical protein
MIDQRQRTPTRHVQDFPFQRRFILCFPPLAAYAAELVIRRADFGNATVQSVTQQAESCGLPPAKSVTARSVRVSGGLNAPLLDGDHDEAALVTGLLLELSLSR